MLTFHLINGLKFTRADFFTILTDLQEDRLNASGWYVQGNLGHTLQKAISHFKDCMNIIFPDPILSQVLARNTSNSEILVGW